MDKLTKGETVTPPVKEVKPSRWWTTYHGWGGLCLMKCFDASGLSGLLLGNPSSFDHAAISRNAGTAALIAVGAAVIGILLSKSLVKAIDVSALPKNGKLIIKIMLPIVYFGAVLLAMATGPLISSSR